MVRRPEWARRSERPHYHLLTEKKFGSGGAAADSQRVVRRIGDLQVDLAPVWVITGRTERLAAPALQSLLHGLHAAPVRQFHDPEGDGRVTVQASECRSAIRPGKAPVQVEVIKGVLAPGGDEHEVRREHHVRGLRLGRRPQRRGLLADVEGQRRLGGNWTDGANLVGTRCRSYRRRLSEGGVCAR